MRRREAEEKIWRKYGLLAYKVTDGVSGSFNLAPRGYVAVTINPDGKRQVWQTTALSYYPPIIHNLYCGLEKGEICRIKAEIIALAEKPGVCPFAT